MIFLHYSYCSPADGISSQECADPIEVYLDFFGMMLLVFAAACSVVIGIAVYRRRKLRRLQHPARDYTRKRSRTREGAERR